jgi:UDP-N-acetyl-D-mannosaminuronate dehydrogenase
LANPGPVGGPCLEKDSYLLSESVEESGGFARIALAARASNENVIEEASLFISNWLAKNNIHSVAKIVILGMAFKGIPETNDLRGSPSVSLINILSNRIADSKIFCWDPVISSIELELLGLNSNKSLDQLLKNASAVILMNNHPFLDNLDLTSLLNSSNGALLVYDFWGRNDSNLSLASNQNYHSWGNHSKGVLNIGAKI